MRYNRIKVDGPATYHVMSKAHESRRFFTDVEKSYMASLMRRLSVFTGCDIITYAFMDNHFHILLHVPATVEISDEEVKRRAKILYAKKKYRAFKEKWSLWEKQNRTDLIKIDLNKFRVRMYDLSEFMKTFKQRLSIYYNVNNDRRGQGCLWQDRFKSVLLEESESTLLTVASYIDLNAVRAGIVKDPKDYRWSGYGEAVAKGGVATDRLSKVFINSDLSRKEVLGKYRESLYVEGLIRYNHLTGEVFKSGFKPEVVEKVLDEGGKLSVAELLYCRVRYFSDGMVIGRKSFVAQIFNEYSACFSKQRQKRRIVQMKNGDWGGLCAAKELRRQIVFVPRDVKSTV